MGWIVCAENQKYTMKKVHLYAPGAARAGTHPVARSDAYSLHFVHVVFGSPGKGCAGAGICKATEIKALLSSFSPAKTFCREGLAKVKAIRPDQLVFYFLVNSMCSTLVQQCFDDNFFIVEHDTVLELTVRGQMVRHFIFAGAYPVTCNPRYRIVHFHPDDG